MAKKTKTHTDSASGDLGDQVRDITQATWFANQQGYASSPCWSVKTSFEWFPKRRRAS